MKYTNVDFPLPPHTGFDGQVHKYAALALHTRALLRLVDMGFAIVQ